MSAAGVGQYGLVKINGAAGFFIRVGQWICRKGFEDYEHAFVCESVGTDGAKVIEAEPGGAKYSTYVPGVSVLWSAWNLTEEQQQAIASAAFGYKGVGYSFLDYIAIGLHQLHVPVPGLKRYISSSRHMICSQLTDQCYRDAGIQLFKDNRWPGFVTPGDLYKRLLQGPL